ncbi:MAG: hypothetical protein LBI56_04505 [Puniceicoccales bacterium]|jgi:hypothetical protein|nr:hypothetical protein [Puniceicoccales bacterium]
MDNIKILNATFVQVNYQTAGIEFDLELQTSDGPQRAVAIVSEVRPLLFGNGLVYLQGKSAKDRLTPEQALSPKTIENSEYPIDSATNAPKVIKAVRYFLDAVNYRNGTRFEEGKALPKDFTG